MALVIRPAEPQDAALIHGLVAALADYERLGHEMVATPEDLARDLFASPARIFCDIAERDGEAAGFALWFYSYSTFQGRYGLYLEDLYVLPKARRAGVGRALLQHLARRCAAERLGRLSWSVLNWNQPAIDFYETLGARLTREWTGCHVEGAALAALGAEP